MVDCIDKFDGEHAFLSNFWPWVDGVKVADADPIIWDGREWPSVEHVFQAAKTFVNEEQEKIRWQETPGKAKRLGRRITLRSDWEKQKLGFMEELLRRKFIPGSDLWHQLVATRPAELIEGNTWGDKFWGAVPWGTQWTEHKWVGENHLGRLLMKIRDEDITCGVQDRTIVECNPPVLYGRCGICGRKV